MEVKESSVDSEVYRFLANIISAGFETKGVRYQKVEFHYPVPKPTPKGKPDEADIVIFGESKGKPVTLIIEAKGRRGKYVEKLDPYSVSVIGQALGYAKALDAQFVATTNGDMLLLFDSYKPKLLEAQIGSGYKVRWDIEFFKKILIDLASYITGTLNLLPVGDAFVARLKYFHELITPSSLASLKDRLNSNSSFQVDYTKWVEEQGFRFDNKTHENIAKQFAYLTINRVLFYKTLETRRKDLKLTPLSSQSDEDFNPKAFTANLETSFLKVVDDVDYEAVFQPARILDDIEITSVLAEYLNEFVRDLEHYDLANIKRDVIGHVYEQMIPPDERKKLGQYYTPPLICDFIADMCIMSPDSKVLDPACGSGGFLLSSYSRMLSLMGEKESNERTHNHIIDHIYGIDINQFAAHLSVVNLSMKNLEATTDKVNVFANDFFRVRINQSTLTPHKKLSIKGQTEVYRPLSANFDAVVANPPYTEQRDIGDKEYKKGIRKVALTFKTSRGGKRGRISYSEKQVKMSSNSGIYAYFFAHSTHFLKNHGRMGYIVSNSWLDTKFGVDLQKFFLNNFKIDAIIEFDHRAFVDAAINTIIIILQKFDEPREKLDRETNLVRFVRVKKPMRIDSLIKLINDTRSSADNDQIKIVVVRQSELQDNSKWSLYLRAPRVFYELQKNKMLVPLSKFGKVKTPLKQGRYEFFVLAKDKASKLGIEHQYLRPVIRTPKEISAPVLVHQDIDNYLLVVNKPKRELSGTNVLKYISYGESVDVEIRKGAKKGKTVKGYQHAFPNKTLWYSLELMEPAEIFVTAFDSDTSTILNKASAYATANFHEIRLNNAGDAVVIAALLSSSLTDFFKELYGRTPLGEGALDIRGYELERIPIVDVEDLDKKQKTLIEDAFLKYSDAKRSEDKLTPVLKEKLDSYVFDALKLDQQQRAAVIKGLNELRQMRQERSKAQIMVDE